MKIFFVFFRPNPTAIFSNLIVYNIITTTTRSEINDIPVYLSLGSFLKTTDKYAT